MIDSPTIGNSISLENLFLVSSKGEYRYADLLHFKEHFMDRINNDGTKPVTFCAPTSDLLVFMIASCWLANVPFVSIDPKISAEKLETFIQQAGPGILISHEKELSNQPEFIDLNSFKLAQILTENIPVRNIDQQHFNHPGSDVFGYLFTSGTSGEQKLVPLKRRQMISATKRSADNLHPGSNKCWLLCLPLHHIGGISVILRSLLYGSAIYRVDKFKTALTAKLLAKDKRIAVASLVPTMLKRLLDVSEFSTHRQFKAILLGGGPISPEMLEEAINRSISVIPSYGMTETCAQIAANPLLDKPKDEKMLQSVGHIFKPNKIEIRDDQNIKLNTDQSGTIWLKGPQVFDGYLNQSNEGSLDKNGWFNTGDYGRLDTDRNLYIEARRTDLIITGGENVSPYEVETVLKRIDSIKEAAVFGVPDEEWGQKVVAAVVLSEEESSTQAIQKVLKKKLETFKIPKEIVVVNSLPKTDTGKIKRSVLENLYQSK